MGAAPAGGLSAAARDLYAALVTHDGSLTLARADTGAEADFDSALAELVELRLVHSVSAERVDVISPSEAAEACVAARERTAYESLREAARIRETLRGLMPLFRTAGRSAAGTEVLVGSRAINARIIELNPGLQHSVCSAHPTMTTAERFQESLAVDAELYARGVKGRTLYTHAALRNPLALGLLRAEEGIGAQVRTTAMIPIRLLLFDDEYALVPIEGDTVAGLVKDPVVVQLLHEIFDFLWERGAPLATDDSARAVPRDTEVALMRELGSGRTDEAIARRLGMSTRSLSRQIAALLDSYGVETRFQLGLAAARAGLIDPEETG